MTITRTEAGETETKWLGKCENSHPESHHPSVGAIFSKTSEQKGWEKIREEMWELQ